MVGHFWLVAVLREEARKYSPPPFSPMVGPFWLVAVLREEARKYSPPPFSPMVGPFWLVAGLREEARWSRFQSWTSGVMRAKILPSSIFTDGRAFLACGRPERGGEKILPSSIFTDGR